MAALARASHAGMNTAREQHMTDAGRTARIKAMSQAAEAPFAITKIGHVVLDID